MALLDEQFTETLQAGAPDITYEGNEGKEQQIAQALWDKLPPQVRMQFGSFAQFFSSGAWKKVLEMLQQQMQGREGQQEVQDPILQQEGQAVQEQGMGNQGIGGLMPQPRPAGMAYGGTPGADGRMQYGIGSWLQKQKDKLIGGAKKYALPALGIGLGAMGLNKLGGNPFFSMPSLSGMGEGLRTIGSGVSSVFKGGDGTSSGGGGLRDLLMNPNFLIPAAGLIGGAFAKPDEPGYTGQGTGLNIADIGKLANISDPQVGQAAGLRFLPDVETRKFTPEQMLETYAGSAHGGRIGMQEGGLMDLGGMEKDYRNDGGFVPLGGEEKADDVPARLSRNEFVFTADAVRNAGAGDMDAGAEVMENVMKNLEGGGKISDESQGKGADEMFEVSERLSEVV
jgi:hypothetical protein